MNKDLFETIEAAMVIVTIIQVIVLIAFFAMAKNVAKIKRSMVIKDADYYIEVAKMEAYLGHKQIAIDNYMRAKYRYETTDSEIGVNGSDVTKEAIEDIDKAIAELQN